VALCSELLLLLFLIGEEMMKNPLYVCSICSQDFTRRYNANRHNQNIHSNKSEIVRFLEYLIGRISGKYLPADPLSYKLKNKNNNNKTTFVHENANNLRHEKSDPSPMNPYTANIREHDVSGKNTNFDSSTKGVKAMTNPTLDYLLYLNTLIQLNDRKHQEYLQKRKIEATLNDIEIMLHDFNHPETVRTLLLN
jgi:hypothetical protein